MTNKIPDIIACITQKGNAVVICEIKLSQVFQRTNFSSRIFSNMFSVAEIIPELFQWLK